MRVWMLELPLLVVLSLGLAGATTALAKKPPRPPPDDGGTGFEIVATDIETGGRRAACRVSSDMRLMTADGNSEKVILRECNCLKTGAAWSPDGSRIVYKTHTWEPYFDGCAGGEGLVTTDLKGLDVRPVGVAGESPAWSPQPVPESVPALGGDHAIAYVLDGDVFAVPVDALGVAVGAPVNLTDTADTNEGHPSWSPTSDRLAYWGRERHIAVLDLATGLETLIPRPIDYGGVYTVDWANTGDRLVVNAAPWTADGPGNPDLSELWVYDLESGTYSFVTQGLNPDADYPSWSSDDTRIVFAEGHVRGEDGVYVINADGTGKTLISSWLWTPDWRR